jgi:hypothetical protein
MGKSYQTFSVLFYIKKNWRGENPIGHIYLRITVNGQAAACSINRTVATDQWNVDKGLVKSRCKDADEINSYINTVGNF